MRTFLIALISLFLLPLASLAQTSDQPNTILVLDGSGSMWGQIDGVNKIVIARTVIAEMLADMRDDQALGLTVYGHRERGSCGDIETIVPPAPGTQAAILDAVNAINPRGRTPMTDAVVAAAQSLRHTENAATVILVSDGIENCNPDPCAIAAELEASGVAFTAHVVGFDVASEPEARAQMQCIAQNTGGLFLTADNASELSAALEQVVMAPTPVMTQFQALIETTGAAPMRAITWRVTSEAGEVMVDGPTGATLSLDLIPGLYTVQATRAEPSGPVAYQTRFQVTGASQGPVAVAMPEIVETARVTFSAVVAPDMTPPVSALQWTMFDDTGTALLGPVEAPGGNVDLLPGAYRLVVQRVGETARFEAAFTVAPAFAQDVVIPLPALLVDVTFSARLDSEDGPLITDPVVWDVDPLMANPVTENPALYQMPRGAYTVTAYWTVAELEQSVQFTLADMAREVVVVFETPAQSATVTAPQTAVAGTMIEVAWTGPGLEGDFIGIGAIDGTGSSRWRNFTYVEVGNPVSLLVPPVPGPHVIRYFLDEGNTPIGETLIEVTPAEVMLDAPREAPAASSIEVVWTGPDYAEDFIGIGRVGTSGSARWERFSYTEGGNPLRVDVPPEPGDYLIRYFIAQDRTPVAEIPLTVTPLATTLNAPASAEAGSPITVTWTGPDAAGDFIGIGPVGASGSARWDTFTYTEQGSPLTIIVPPRPGDYLVTYFLDDDRTPLAQVPLSVTAIESSVSAPARAEAGTTIPIDWTGPAYDGDFIGIGPVGASGSGQWRNFTYTEDGSPTTLLVPPTAGDYVIRYYLDQDREAIAETAITVTPAVAQVSLKTITFAPGDRIEVDWTGPGYPGDFIGIGLEGTSGSAQWRSFAATEDGSPAILEAPEAPGRYLIQYFLDQDRTPVATVAVTIQ